MQVSIIVINYNTPELTRRCIESIRDKTLDVDYEIIVVDNASDDDSVEILRLNCKGINLIESKENLGFAKGNNLGITHANGEYILLLNSDTLFKNNAIKHSLDFIKRNKNIGVVTAKLMYPDGKVQDNCQRFPSIPVALFELFRLQKLFPKWGERVLLGSFFRYNQALFLDWVWGTYFFFPVSILRQFPEQKLNDDFFMYCEDIQWCLEIHKLKHKVAFDPSAEIIHLMGASGANAEKMMEQNKELLYKKYYSKLYIHLWKLILRII